MTEHKHISFNEIVVGFKCQTCFWAFTETDNEDEWVDIEFTQEVYDKYIGLIMADAIEVEFRVPI